MGIIRSLIYSAAEMRFNPLALLHLLAYAATVTYLRGLRFILSFHFPTIRNHVTETYHSKVVRLDDAKKIVRIGHNVECRELEQVIPFQHARDIVLKNPGNIVAYECACRGQKKDSCKPSDVCLVIGDPFVDLVRLFQPFRSRRITPEEALKILEEEDRRGHIHTAWFKTAMLNRFYAICNCCRCCCLGLRFMTDYGMNMVLPSGYLAVIEGECIGCGECIRHCVFGAIQLVTAPGDGSRRKKAVIDFEKCFGCGVCEGQCRQDCISLHPHAGKGMPLNIEALAN